MCIFLLNFFEIRRINKNFLYLTNFYNSENEQDCCINISFCAVFPPCKQFSIILSQKYDISY